jgi:quercetin dioxygenase-like cupin family protein
MVQQGRFKGEGWVAGHMGQGSLHTENVGVKWAFQPKGDAGGQWRTCKTATTLSVLMSGKFKMVFRESSGAPEEIVILSEPGQYAIFGPGIQHWSEALEDTWFLTLRWPSLANDCAVIQ